jgi:hypothetical protein
MTVRHAARHGYVASTRTDSDVRTNDARLWSAGDKLVPPDRRSGAHGAFRERGLHRGATAYVGDATDSIAARCAVLVKSLSSLENAFGRLLFGKVRADNVGCRTVPIRCPHEGSASPAREMACCRLHCGCYSTGNSMVLRGADRLHAFSNGSRKFDVRATRAVDADGAGDRGLWVAGREAAGSTGISRYRTGCFRHSNARLHALCSRDWWNAAVRESKTLGAHFGLPSEIDCERASLHAKVKPPSPQ